MTYGECTDCRKWGFAPTTFNEGKHFLKCPICKKPMYLVHGDPNADGLRDTNKVEITEFIKHNG